MLTQHLPKRSKSIAILNKNYFELEEPFDAKELSNAKKEEDQILV